jgi:dTMP kinase
MAAEPKPGSKSGFFLTFEGLDGSGKTTQIRKLAAWLEAQNLPHVLTRQPGGTVTGDRIRALLLDSKSANLAPKTELAMMFADRAQAIQEVIQPALNSGQVVVCDRFTDSTEAYQGGGRQLGSEIVLELHRLLCGDLQPDLTILLLPDLAQSLARARRRNHKSSGPDEGRFEAEKDAFFERTHAKYQQIAARNPLRVITIDGNLSIDEVHRQVINAVEPRLKSRMQEQGESWPAQPAPQPGSQSETQP